MSPIFDVTTCYDWRIRESEMLPHSSPVRRGTPRYEQLGVARSSGCLGRDGLEVCPLL
jgi:hypothetical protein